jgi:hypothetical protein
MIPDRQGAEIHHERNVNTQKGISLKNPTNIVLLMCKFISPISTNIINEQLISKWSRHLLK